MNKQEKLNLTPIAPGVHAYFTAFERLFTSSRREICTPHGLFELTHLAYTV
jgi:hypothetical protein